MTTSWLGFKEVADFQSGDDDPLTSEDSFIGGVPVGSSISCFLVADSLALLL